MINNQSSGSTKKNYSAQFKFDRALEIIKGGNAAEVARKCELSANVLYLWHDQLLAI